MAKSGTLLTVGHPAWERLEREKLAARRRSPDTPVEELLLAGQRVSTQAAALRRAIVNGRRGPGT
jgi:hypothetical protein